MSDQEQIAAFLAKRGATQCAPAIAYGVNAEADKAKRAEARYAARTEQESERFMEGVREAYHTGGRNAAIEAMNVR